MDISNYIDAKKEFQDIFLLYIDDENDDETNYTNLVNIIDKQNLHENDEEFKIFYYFICNIINNHYRGINFFNKLERIFLPFSEDIKNIFSNTEIYSHFKKNNRFLIFLINHQIITIDEDILKLIYENNPGIKYLYFQPELKSFFDDQTNEAIDKEMIKNDLTDLTYFEEKRQIGENCSLICQLIRNDSIEDFIIYTNNYNISLSSKINYSIYETNPFLIKNEKTTLIEYAAFFGSIQIFQYLRLNNVDLNPSLWLYAIHGQNPDIIHLLEESEVIPKNNSFEQCLEMAIECHQNDIANYIYDNLLDQKNINKDFDMNFHSYCFRFVNFAFFPNDIDFEYYLSYLCKYGYFTLVDLFIKSKGFDIQNKLISHDISPLFVAANENNEKIFNLLISLIKYEISDKLFKECRNLKKIIIPSSVKLICNECFYNCSSLIEVTIPSSVTSIENKSFYGCKNLKQISIPSSVTSIGDECFRYCYSLKEVTIPSSVISVRLQVFDSCISLQHFSIPSSLTSIAGSFFCHCSSLSHITIPSSIKSIESYAFYDCSKLKEIEIPSSVTSIGNSAFGNCISLTQLIIPFSVSSISSYAFGGCESLVRIAIPSSITSIGDKAFYKCSSLKQIKILSSTNSIVENYFDKCELDSFDIPSSVTSIGKGAFRECKSLAQINLPSSLKIINARTFECCCGLKQIIIPPSVTEIKESAFECCRSLKQIYIPSSVTEIGNNAFKKCYSLEKIEIPSSVKKIEKYCFYSCSSLINISIPESVTEIGEFAFTCCSSLTQISIPSSVTKIGDYAFDGCRKLTNVSIPSDIIYDGNHIFHDCPFGNDSNDDENKQNQSDSLQNCMLI